jgi:uncharacterized protein YlxW (UPF0749 family)
VPLALLGFLIVLAVSSTRAERRSSEPRRTRLVELIESRRNAVGKLDDEVRDLRGRVGTATARASRSDASERERAQRLRELGTAAGTTALTGPGLVVKLSDSSRRPSTAEEASAFRIHDADMQLVANALFASGAEAVSINGSRLVATSPIRAAGSTIVVNFRPLIQPYEVVAIGARRADFEASDIARRFNRWKTLFGLGFDVGNRSGLVVSAFTGQVDVAVALPSEGAG